MFSAWGLARQTESEKERERDLSAKNMQEVSPALQVPFATPKRASKAKKHVCLSMCKNMQN